MWACKYKKACEWALLVVWSSDFEHFSSSNSFGSALFFSDFQCNQYIQLLLIWFKKKKICNDWRQKLCEKWPMFTTFFLTATVAITGKQGHEVWVFSPAHRHSWPILGIHLSLVNCIWRIVDNRNWEKFSHSDSALQQTQKNWEKERNEVREMLLLLFTIRQIQFTIPNEQQSYFHRNSFILDRFFNCTQCGDRCSWRSYGQLGTFCTLSSCSWYSLFVRLWASNFSMSTIKTSGA